MDIVLHAPHEAVPSEFVTHAQEKLEPLARYDDRARVVDVTCTRANSSRQPKSAASVDLMFSSSGEPLRAHGDGPDWFRALDVAAGRLETLLRRRHDRRRVSYGTRTPQSLADASARATLAADEDEQPPEGERAAE
jgi:ribosomal subunit interface protein